MADNDRQVVIITSALSIAAGSVGTVAGASYSTALGTDPAWIGPALLVAGIGAIVVGLLLLPAAIRALRSRNAP
jgi:hypothetical protein